MSPTQKSGATREPNEPMPKDAVETGGGSSPPAPDQPPDFDPDDEETFGQFRRYMDRYFGELERIVDAEPQSKPDGAGTRTAAPSSGGDDSKPAPEKEVPSTPFTPQPSGGSFLHVLLGAPKAKRR